MATNPRNPDVGTFGEQDRYLFLEGTHYRLFEHLGAHPVPQGCRFAVWAPNARSVSVMGDFNSWDAEANPLLPDEGIWRGSLAGVRPGARYKYRIVGYDGQPADKSDPFALSAEISPQTASRVCDLNYDWDDGEWLAWRANYSAHNRPLSIYEVHLGSWRRKENNQFLTYRELARPLADYVKKMNFTHVELLPLMEHPFYGSWGYQVTGYFAPTSRYGAPQDLMFLIDYLHRQGIGVILDWVPSHFATDAHGLGRFDGTALFEHADPRQGYHPDWGSYIFNYGRGEVRSFLLSSAMFWLDVYHADGLRVDGVASMLYLDYSRKPGEWVPNRYGGRENLEAIDFLKNFNRLVHSAKPGAMTIAEESTSWPLVSRPVEHGGLGFDMKWDMGWMHDTLAYLAQDPIFRKFHHQNLTFRGLYAFSEDYVLSLSHDEVVHAKGSLLGRMPGDDWQRFANLRVLFGYMYSQPGKKLIFMGDEFGQWSEWNHDASLDWHLLESGRHDQLRRWLEDLNRFYRDEPALHDRDFDPQGFQWISPDDSTNSVICYVRRGQSPADIALIVCNFTPVMRDNYRVGAPQGGIWREVLNSDAQIYGGSGKGNFGAVEATPVYSHGQSHSLNLTVPPLAMLVLEPASK
jgi:1,4-alpha-glucan branching enzyme